MSTEEKSKAWQRTTPGLLGHRGGRYYGRFSSGGKTKFVLLETDLLEIARTRFAEHSHATNAAVGPQRIRRMAPPRCATCSPSIARG